MPWDVPGYSGVFRSAPVRFQELRVHNSADIEAYHRFGTPNTRKLKFR